MRTNLTAWELGPQVTRVLELGRSLPTPSLLGNRGSASEQDVRLPTPSLLGNRGSASEQDVRLPTPSLLGNRGSASEQDIRLPTPSLEACNVHKK
jgi:hypothetical protein